MIDACIFDLDGTLLDTIYDIKFIADEALKTVGLPESPLEVVRNSIGDGSDTLIKRLINFRRETTEEEVQKLHKEYLNLYVKYEGERVKVFPGMRETLAEMSKQNIKFAILSNKPEINVRNALKRFYPEFEFVKIIGGDSGYPLKPDAKGLNDIIRELNVKLSDALYVGDGDTDVTVAKNGNVLGVSALWGYRDKEYLKSFGAVNFAEKPSDLLKFII